MTIDKIMGMKNQEFAKTVKSFQDACEKAGIPPTKRQASKWRNKKGIAFLGKK